MEMVMSWAKENFDDKLPVSGAMLGSLISCEDVVGR